MIKYLAKTEIGGVEIRLVQSDHAIVVLYGMEKKQYSNESTGWAGYRRAVDHAIRCL